MSPPLPAPHGFSANLSHPWDTEDLCFLLVLFSAWWLLVSLVPSGLSISYLWCFSAVPQLQQSWDKQEMGGEEHGMARVPGHLWTGNLS